MGTSAVKGDGLYEGLDWLSSQLKQEEAKKRLSAPVNTTVKEVSETTGRLSAAIYRLGSIATSWWTQNKTTTTTTVAS